MGKQRRYSGKERRHVNLISVYSLREKFVQTLFLHVSRYNHSLLAAMKRVCQGLQGHGFFFLEYFFFFFYAICTEMVYPWFSVFPNPKTQHHNKQTNS